MSSRKLRSPKQAPVYSRAGLCRGREVCLVQEMAAIYPVPGQTSLAATAAPQTGACLPSRRLRSPKQAPVYSRANCVASNRRLFSFAQIAGHRTGTCLPSRRLRSPKQAPVYSRANCVVPNRRLFAFAQIAWPQTGACLPSRRLRSLKQAPVWHYTKCRTLNRHLFTLTQLNKLAQRASATQQFNNSTGERQRASTPQHLNN